MSKELLTALEANGLTDYGSDIPREFVHEVLGIVMPEIATKKEFDAIAILELGAVDYVRNILLGQGKYITASKSGYRVLLPSENVSQVEAYIGQADKKLSRALKLSRNTPDQFKPISDNTEVRVLLKRNTRRAIGA